MAQLPRHCIVLAGTPLQSEQGVATAAITPGMLVQGTLSVAPHATAGGNTPRDFALERQEMGKGIDVAYAIGDQVKVGSFKPGDRVYAFVASGQNIAIDGKLESAGDGTLRALAAGTAIGKALEAVNNTAGPTNARLRVQVM
jgi:hypothetical protein